MRLNAAKFRLWVNKTVGIKSDVLYRRVLETVSEMEKASEGLAQLLNELSKIDELSCQE